MLHHIELSGLEEEIDQVSVVDISQWEVYENIDTNMESEALCLRGKLRCVTNGQPDYGTGSPRRIGIFYKHLDESCGLDHSTRVLRKGFK